MYRQVQFAEFERYIHNEITEGRSLQAEKLENYWLASNEEYYGPALIVDKELASEWSRIPHFYTPFYVYQYATSFTSSMLIYEKVKAKEPEAFTSYVNLLRSGGSDFPIEQVKKAGVDLTSKEPFEAVVSRMSELVDLLEKELEAK